MTVRSALATAAVLALATATNSAQVGRSGIDLSSIDASVRPQDDLFRYVNGGWLAKTEIPPDRPSYGTFEALAEQSQADVYALMQSLSSGRSAPADGTAKQLGDFFASFMDEAGIEKLGASPLASRLAEVDAVKNTTELAALLGTLSLQGLNGPVNDGVNPDASDPMTDALYVAQSDLPLPDQQYYLSTDPKFVEIRTKYTAYLERIFTLAGRPNAAADAKAVLDLETALAKIQWTPVEDRDAVKTYNKYAVAKLVADAPGFDWAAWGRAQGITASTWIVREPSYFTSFAAMVPATPLATWKAWVAAEIIAGDAPYLSKAFVDARFDFLGRTLIGQQAQRDRWKRGVALLDNTMGEAVGQLYVAAHFPPASKARAQALVANLLAAYQHSITTLDWMTPGTKQQALAKLAKIRTKIGYPDKWRDYHALRIDAHDLVGNVERATAFESAYQLAKVGRPVDHNDWDMSPQTVNAYYSAENNEIVFPAAILQAPFFDPSADDAANYGAIGAVIGHEIGHGFDDQGRKYDGDGRLHDWWTAADAAEFDKRAKLLVAQFNAYVPFPGAHENGELTLGENIGDLGGLSIAYQAWKISLAGRPAPVIDGLAGDRRFFMSWAQAWRGKARPEFMQEQVLADPHAWNEFRVDGPVSDIQAFYDAFGVKPGDKLYREPDQRVRIW